MGSLMYLPEPNLLFGYGQSLEDPRDGLTLFGPLDETSPYGIRAGVIGTKRGLEAFDRWVNQIQRPIFASTLHVSRPPFPGFQAAFRVPWRQPAFIRLEIPEEDLFRVLYLDDKHERVYRTVDLFSSAIVDTLKHEDTMVDVWFIVIPDQVRKYCRPLSSVEPELRIVSRTGMSFKKAMRLKRQIPLFEEDYEEALPYYYEVNFHNQLKARLLEYSVPTQIILESTISHQGENHFTSESAKSASTDTSAVAWNISTTAYYKAGGRPWKISGVREGVCYVGIVFKRDERQRDPRYCCCAAQMFLDSGDGVVFKGAVGPWYSPSQRDFHLNRLAAEELVGAVVRSYSKKTGRPPRELFLHGRARFSDSEWQGFEQAVDRTKTNLVGVTIRTVPDLRLYRQSTYPILRGMALPVDDTSAYLWTKGYVPRLQTYAGKEVPVPLQIEICRGQADLCTVLKDIMALTKLNYNACMFSDGQPVTLRFAGAVGEILTAGPLPEFKPLPFKYYI